MKPPLISIGMPVMNGETYLKEAIESILTQSYKHFELIIADDNSTDDSKTIIDRYAHRDTRVRFIKHKRQQGRAENFNYVLKEAKGDYFLWHSQDDLRDPLCLAKLMQLLQKNPQAVVAVSRFTNVHQDQMAPHVIRKKADWSGDLATFLRNPDLSFFYGLWRTDVLTQTGGYYADSRPFFASSDFVTICRPLLHGDYVYTPELLFFKRDTGLHTTRYAELQRSLHSKITQKTILRYILFPYFFFLDRVILSRDIFKTDKSFTSKISLFIFLWTSLVIELLRYIKTIIIGIPALLSGIKNVIMRRS